MSSWDTNPGSNFCDPRGGFICQNKWHPATSEIVMPMEIAVGTHFHVRDGTKATPMFLPADREAFGRYFWVQSLYYQAAQCNQKTPIAISSWWQVRSEKGKKGEASTLTTAPSSIHLPKSVSIDQTIKSDSVLTNPVGKDGVWDWSM